MEKVIEKARLLIEVLPYIKQFNGKVVVIKYGGSAMLDEKLKKSVIQDIVLMKLVGIKPVIVHGGGKDISKMLNQLGKETEFYNGLRVTDKETMDTVQMVLCGKINKDIVQYIENNGIKSVGISGKDGSTIKATKKLAEGKDLGFVGEVKKIDITLLNTLIKNDFIPVVAPVAADEEGNTYNINADYAASYISGALKAEKLIFLTDIEGVMTDINDSSTLISKLYVNEIDKKIKAGTIFGGMIPKVNCCVDSIKSGVTSVHILDGRIEHSLLLETFTNKGLGTMITN